MNKTPSKALLALTAAAAALPGYQGTAQAWAEYESDAAYRFSFYQEDNLPAGATTNGQGERYEIATHQFHLLRPLSEEWDYSADVMVETMSGASPWFVVPDADGQPIQVMSGATIDEDRVAVQGKLRKYGERSRHSYSLGVSKEKDYRSISGGIEGEWELAQRQQTLSAGLGYSADQLTPTDGGSARFPNRIREADKSTVTAYAGITQAWTPRTLAQLTLGLSYGDGYLSDPYKQAYVDGDLLPDSRPQRRQSWSLTGRIRHYLERFRAALHLDARYFADDWGVGADTLEIAWVQKLDEHWRWAPRLRWYEQGYADFYRPYFTAPRADGYYSSDYRLSAYGALSLRLGLDRVNEKGWSFGFAVETYDSEGGYALRNVNRENPGLVDFMVFSAALSYTWSALEDSSTPLREPISIVTPIEN